MTKTTTRIRFVGRNKYDKVTSNWSESPLTDRLLRQGLARWFVEVQNPNIIELVAIIVQRLEIEVHLVSVVTDLPVALNVEFDFLNIQPVYVLVILLVVEIRIVVVKVHIFYPIVLEKNMIKSYI